MTERPVAVITGGARGIGRQVAADLVTRGYRVVIGDLDEEATRRTAAELGAAVTGVRLDITDRALVAQTIDLVENTIGPIAVWVNNAGIMPTGAFASQDVGLARAVIDVDYAALVEVTSAILPRFLARNAGTLINLGSATGLKPLAGLAVYSGAKAAVIGFSDALRRELRGTGVRVRVILPNLVSTPMGAGITPPRLSPAVTPEQVSRAVVRAIDHGPFAVTVPRVLGPVLRVSRLLPTTAQDWLDDRIGTDRIGLGGDPAARAAYQAGLPAEPH
ncbi:MAG: SDR family NAD(P)-dependent oxidoreductase [Cryobacterium sp.]